VAAAVLGGPVSEFSVRHDAYSGKWLMMYLQGGAIVLRSAPAATGPWSGAQVVVGADDYPMLCGGFMHQVVVLRCDQRGVR
jgi:Domain of unknown function (DUF4185)